MADYESGTQQMSNRNFDKAIERFDKAISQAKASSTYGKFLQYALYKKAQCYLEWGKYDEAIKAYQDLKSQVPETKFLRELYSELYRCWSIKNDLKGMEATLREFDSDIAQKRLTEWQGEVDIMKAEFYEMKSDFNNALTHYTKHTKNNDAVTKDKALAGELRCLLVLKKFDDLERKAKEVASSSTASASVLAAAYNGLGAAHLKNGKNEEAKTAFLMSYFRYASPGTAEREYALYGSVASIARLAASQADATKKETYKKRAEDLLAELEHGYPKSTYIKDAKADIGKIK